MSEKGRNTAGALEDLALAEIVQMLSLGLKTARVLVNSADGAGRIWFVDGRAVHATQCGLRGIDAFYRMLEWDRGQFVIEHDRRCRQRTIEEDTMYIVMESLRKRDEAAARAAAAGQRTAADAAGQRVFRTAIAVAALFVLVTVWLMVDALEHRHRSGPGVVSGAAARVVDDAPAIAGPPDFWESFTADRRRRFAAAAAPVVRREPEARSPSRAAQPVTSPVAETVVRQSTAATGPSKPSAVIYDPLAVPCVRNRTLELPPPPAFVRLRARSKVQRGSLVVLANGEEVFRHDFVPRSKGLKRFFEKMTGGRDETFEGRIELTAGRQRLVARLIRPNKKDRESVAEFELVPGDVRTVGLAVGIGSGSPLTWRYEAATHATESDHLEEVFVWSGWDESENR